jgi:hypothetical protein
MANLNILTSYLLFVFKVIADSFLDIVHELDLCDVLLVFEFMFLLDLLKVSEFRFHDNYLASCIVELIAEYICLLLALILLDVRETIVNGLASFDALLMNELSEVVVIDIRLLLRFEVIHQIKLTITLILYYRSS